MNIGSTQVLYGIVIASSNSFGQNVYANAFLRKRRYTPCDCGPLLPYSLAVLLVSHTRKGVRIMIPPLHL